MYTRDYKIFSSGDFFHIYNRGNNKQDIFLDEGDYNFFILRLKQNLYPDKFDELKIQPLPPNSFSLISYCLMPNHFHLLIKQNSEIPTSKLMLKLCSSYSKVFNKKHERVGHVFQDQFKQIPINSDGYLKWVISYICQNPKVAGLVKNLNDYKWSSYLEHINKISTANNICDTKVFDELFVRENVNDFIESSFEIIKKNKIEQHLDSEFLID